jgi:benzoate transport
VSPKDIIDTGRMSALQWLAVAITIGLNALDGFDVLSISFASPGIAKEWGIDRGVLGFVLSMELIGMAVGSVVLGGLADKIGRRSTVLGCLVVMAFGMIMATTAHGVSDLSIWRVLTGLGIGGMLAAINAAAAEFSNVERRKVAMALMVIGYPLGAALGGAVSSLLLKGSDWRIVFEIGAIATLIFIPLVWFFLPETPAFLAEKRPAGALEAINRTLMRFGHPAADALPPLEPAAVKRSMADILGPDLRTTTLLATFAYFAHVITFYFILKWVPKLVVDMGYAPSAAGWVLVAANVGGATGGAIFGLLAGRFGLKPLTLFVLVMSTVMVTIFGHGQSSYGQLVVTIAITGMFTNSAIVGFYSIFAHAFPTHLRATGTGFAIGIGRGGSALAPAAAGALFASGYGLQTVALVMSVGSVLAALAVSRMRFRD